VSAAVLRDGGNEAVWICLCNALADTRIIEVVADGARRPRDVYAACGCRAQCGGCAKAVLRLIQEGRAGAAAVERRRAVA
jgi:bacterioferritin-associated ferredoxin